MNNPDSFMSLKSSDLDAIFNGAGAVINSTANVCGAIANGVNDVRNIVDASRRNQQMPNGYGYGYTQPVTYGYGYADNSTGYGYQSTGYTNYPNQSPSTGYVGFTDPGYGSLGSVNNNMNPNGFYSVPSGGAWG